MDIKHWCLFSKIADAMGANNYTVPIFMSDNKQRIVMIAYSGRGHI